MADIVAEFLRDCGPDPMEPAGRLETAMQMARERALDGAILDINLDLHPVAVAAVGSGTVTMPSAAA